MVFDLKSLMPKEKRSLDAEKMQQYSKYYAETLPKFGYMRDADNAESYDFLCRYFAEWYGAKQNECDYPRKGLFLFGEKGTGKTTAMKIFSGLFNIEIVPIEDFTIAFTCGKETAFWEFANSFNGQPVIIDDVCNEREAKAFGNTMPLPEFFKRRESAWHDKGIHTFFTSNAKDRNEITKLYGDTITSRFLGSCHFLKFIGPDRRITRRNTI